MKNKERLTVLEVLDPGHGHPGYWDRFRARIMERAVFELAMRRERARESVASVLSGWSRSLIPVALAAVVIAAFIVSNEARRASDATPLLVLEDVLASDSGEGPFQALLGGEALSNPVAFMALVEENSP